MMTSDRWQIFDKRTQLLTIGAEFERARVWETQGDVANVRGALERALFLIDLMLDDPKWRGDLAMLLGLRGAVGRYYVGDETRSVALLSQAL